MTDINISFIVLSIISILCAFVSLYLSMLQMLDNSECRNALERARKSANSK